MNIAILLASAVLLIVGLTTGLASRRHLTESGKATPWHRRLTLFWLDNAAYTAKGQKLVRVSSVTGLLGVLLYLISSHMS